jgi:MOSC domain-containing protein YiiM
MTENYTINIAKVVAVCTSPKTGMRKKNVNEGILIEDLGIQNDAHANSETHRQVSFLAMESIKKMQDMGLDVHEGDFAENITTSGIDLLALPIGSKITIGDKTLLEISQHGKVCHKPCAIYHQAGTCVMPKEGIFAKVIKGGEIKTGDPIITITDKP